MAESVTDMTGGLYRRIYAGFLTGRRINAVSIEAEAWFWRLHAVADDFGNLHGDPTLLKAAASPRRDIKLKNVGRWNSELQSVGLITAYEASDGETYIHIDGWESRQPAGKNGKRIQRHPGVSGCIQVNPGVPGKSQAYKDKMNNKDKDNNPLYPPSGDGTEKANGEYRAAIVASLGWNDVSSTRRKIDRIVKSCEELGASPDDFRRKREALVGRVGLKLATPQHVFEEWDRL